MWQFIVARQLQAKKDAVASAVFRDVFGMKMYLITPSAAKLKKLRKKYANPGVPLEKQEGLEISMAMTAKGNDYLTKLMDFDLRQWKEDNNADNGSSISLLTELNGFKVLWLADAHPGDIVAGLEKLGFTPEKPLHCDWVKVTHHGSKGNNSDGVYDRIRCANYLFSVDGENLHYLPNKEAIARILRNPLRNVKAQPYTFYFTHDNATLRGIFEVDGKGIFEDLNFKIFYSKAKYIQVPIETGSNSLS